MNKEEDDSKPNWMTSTRSAHGSNIHSSPFCPFLISLPFLVVL